VSLISSVMRVLYSELVPTFPTAQSTFESTTTIRSSYHHSELAHSSQGESLYLLLPGASETDLSIGESIDSCPRWNRLYSFSQVRPLISLLAHSSNQSRQSRDRGAKILTSSLHFQRFVRRGFVRGRKTRSSSSRRYYDSSQIWQGQRKVGETFDYTNQEVEERRLRIGRQIARMDCESLPYVSTLRRDTDS